MNENHVQQRKLLLLNDDLKHIHIVKDRLTTQIMSKS